MFKEYEKTGYVWEQYSCVDGHGSRSHPFTGTQYWIIFRVFGISFVGDGRKLLGKTNSMTSFNKYSKLLLNIWLGGLVTN
jgi:hypothetical protein